MVRGDRAVGGALRRVDAAGHLDEHRQLGCRLGALRAGGA